VKFYLEPPGIADPFAKLRYLETIEISSEGEYAICCASIEIGHITFFLS
jgi:hypothetical protein